MIFNAYKAICEANREELAMLRNADRAKRAFDREALATAWNADIRMKNIWKAIDNHSKVAKGPAKATHRCLNTLESHAEAIKKHR